MKTYRVTYQQTEVRTYVLEAQSEAEARRKAEQPWKLAPESSYPGEFQDASEYEVVDVKVVS